MMCLGYGECVAKNGKCVAALDADCEATPNCDAFGVCKAIDGKCRATAEACAGTVCKEQGHCVLLDDYCQATEQGCKASSHCKMTGACARSPKKKDSLPQYFCEPKDDADCKQSDLCKHSGQCKRVVTDLGASCKKG